METDKKLHPKNNLFKLLRIIVFCIILASVIMICTSPFKVHETINYQHVAGFYAEKPDSLDAVYVGASNVYKWWEPPVAWRNCGITSFDFSVAAMPPRAIRYMIEEARKTQPDALYIVNLNNIKSDHQGYVVIHKTVDFMKFSPTKIALIDELCKHADIRGLDKLEFYFPFIRFHSGWTELQPTDFGRHVDGLKGGDISDFFLEGFQDLSHKMTVSDERIKMEDYQKEILDDLIDYSKKNNIKILFVAEPQLTIDANTIGEVNTMADYAEAQGMDVLNLWEDFDTFNQIGFDLSQDFGDERHVNVHGANKYTSYLAKYLQNKYNFTDKRGDSSFDEWVDTTSRYDKLISTSTLDFERSDEERDPGLAAPEIKKLEQRGREIFLEWSPSENADSYLVYRRMMLDSDGHTDEWTRVASTVDTTYTDSGLRARKTYFYTVVPVKNVNGSEVYGHFIYTGVSDKTSLDVPKNITAKRTADGVTVSWNAADDVDGYAVYRTNEDGSWKRIAAVSADTLNFTDTGDTNTKKCRYSVSSYIVTKDKSRYYGYYDPSGVPVE